MNNNADSALFTRRDFLALPAAAALGCSGLPGRSDPIFAREGAARSAARYLWSLQADDGGWHSRTYGLLASGQSMTAFLLDALTEVPEKLYEPASRGRRRAVEFLADHTDSEGAVGRSDPLLPDYPNYATALTVAALRRLGRPARDAWVSSMTDYLRGQQFTEQNSWGEDHPVYGAWGMGGDRRTPPATGHVDLSMTRHVLQALAAADTTTGAESDRVSASTNRSAFRKAAVFVNRCHHFGNASAVDGGFHFSTVIFDANKAGEGETGFESYGTATADGILSLLALGRETDHPSVQAAAEWLSAHHLPDQAPGFPKPTHHRWRRGLWYYYAAVSGAALRRLGLLPALSTADALAAVQRPDGSFANPENLVKEDDPLIATGLALRALVNALS